MKGRRGKLICALASTLALACGTASADASVVTFGTNLEQPANAPLSCGEGMLNQFLGKFLYGPFGGTCMWSSVVVGSAVESLTAPSPGPSPRCGSRWVRQRGPCR